MPSAHQVVWVHDEVQVECAEQDAETVGKLAVDAIVKTGNHYLSSEQIDLNHNCKMKLLNILL